MGKMRYAVYVDGSMVWESNSIKSCKEKANFEFDFLNAFHAEIKCYNKVYAYRFYNGTWSR